MGLFDKWMKPNVAKMASRGDLNGLVQALLHKDKQIVEEAVAALIRIGQPVSRPLADLLLSACQNGQAARQAKEQLHNIQEFIDALESSNPDRRQAAQRARENMGAAQAKALDEAVVHYKKIVGTIHNCERIIETVPCVLAEIGGPEIIEALVKVLAYDNNSYDLEHARERATLGLCRLGDSRASLVLVRRLFKEHSSRQDSIVDRLIKIGHPVVEPLLSALKDKEKCTDDRGLTPAIFKRIPEIFVSVGKPAVEQLLEALRDTNLHNNAKCLIVEALAEIGDERAVDILISMYNAGYVADALAKIGGVRATEFLLARGDNFNALAMTGDPRAADIIAKDLSSPETWKRKWAAETLAKMGDERGFKLAVEPLVEMLGCPRWLGRKEAASSLIEIISRNPSIPISNLSNVQFMIQSPHVDEGHSGNRKGESDCHSDHEDNHTDRGIGLSFPPTKPGSDF